MASNGTPDNVPAPTSAPAPAPARLSLRTKLGFGVGDLGGNLFFTAMGFYGLFYLTEIARVSAAIAGVAFAISKVWDALADPLMGYVSDNTRTRWGRRRPYLLFGSVPLLLAVWYFFSAPTFHTETAQLIWASAMLIVMYTAYTVVNIPYGALTPELTKDFKERSTLNGFRFSFAVVGTILGAAAAMLVGFFGTDARFGWSMTGLVFGAVMAVTTLLTFSSVREPDHSAEPRVRTKFFSTYFTVFRNRDYLKLALVYTFHLTGLTFVQAMLPYYFKYVFKNDGMTTIALLLMLVVAMLFIPVSVAVSKRIGKKATYQIALGILAVACLIIFFLGHVLGMYFTIGVMVLAGIGVGFAYVPPFAMLPDVVEVDAVRTKTRKEGAYYGMWTFFTKIGSAAAIILTGFLLALAGFQEPTAANQVVSQSDSALVMMRWLIGVIPFVFFLGGTLLVQLYPLDEKTYDAIVLEYTGK